MARKDPPLESFGPELMAALIQGSNAHYEIPMTFRQAVNHRQRLNTLRRVMVNVAHPMAKIVSLTKIAIRWDDTVPVRRSSKNVRIPVSLDAPVRLVIEPYDKEFAIALGKAGIHITPPDPLPDIPEPAESLEDILNRNDKDDH